MTIDPQARSQLAEAARWLGGGRITNWEFDDRVPDSSDPAIREIYNHYLWLLYSDTPEYRLLGPKNLPATERAKVTRCVLFLKSNLPYRWPVLSGAQSVGLTILNLFTLGLAGRIYFRRVCAAGDISLWPFQSASQYAEALASPSYLAGAGC